MTAPIVRNTTFPTVGIQGRAGGGAEGLPWGTGAKISYIVNRDEIRVEFSDGRTLAFDNAGAFGRPFATFSATTGTDSSGRTTNLMVSAPEVEGVPLTYLRWASAWLSGAFGPTGEITVSQFLFGAHTRAMPTSGSASYKVAVYGSAIESARLLALDGGSTASLTANFQTGEMSTLLHLIGTPSDGGSSVDLREVTGGAAISNGAFAGTFDGVSGGFWGAFFGPAAAEAGYIFSVETGAFVARGYIAGRKN